MTRVLLTTTSFQDTPGEHHEMLAKAGYELVCRRGPLTEEQMLSDVGEIDAFLCGDDAITQQVIDKALPRLKVISKYGIGLDKIDVKYATEKKIPVLFTPGVNHTTVSEHTFALMLSLQRKLVEEVNHVRSGNWKRLTGHEVLGKTMGIVGMGRIGKEVATRARAFGMNVIGYDIYWDDAFAANHQVERVEQVDELIKRADVISLHTNLTEETRDLINKERLAMMKPTTLVLNCARGELVDTAAMVEALNAGTIGGYGTDVLDVEPPPADHPLLSAPNCVITPHIGSRTYESVARQAGMACDNLIRFLSGEKPLAQANSF